MNNYSKELCHWAFGEKKKNHKYIDRIRDAANKTWRYIYELPKKSQKVAKNFSDSWKDGAETIGKRVSDSFNKAKNTTINAAKKKYDEYRGKKFYNVRLTSGDKVHYFETEKEAKQYSKRMGKETFERLIINPAKKFVNKIFEAVGVKYRFETIEDRYAKIKIGQKFARNYNDINVPDYVKSPPRPILKKIAFENGETRVLYTKEQVEAWERIEKYQDEEPMFMKDVKNIMPDINGDLPTTKENMDKTNPAYWYEPLATVNCWHCATAYDLRKRGYDVSALPIGSNFKYTDLDDIYEVTTSTKDKVPIGNQYDAETANTYSKVGGVAINASSSWKDAAGIVGGYAVGHGEETLGEAILDVRRTDGKVLILGAVETSNGGAVYTSPINVIAKKLDNGTIKNVSEAKNILSDDARFGELMASDLESKLNKMPNDSWGRVSIQWKESSGGHSFVWEKDKNGKLIFIDAQTDEKVDLKDYAADASRALSLVAYRTDNLKLKENVLDYIADNHGGTNKSADEVAAMFNDEIQKIEKQYEKGEISAYTRASRLNEIQREAERYDSHTAIKW